MRKWRVVIDLARISEIVGRIFDWIKPELKAVKKES
jgi:hypothetical protein